MGMIGVGQKDERVVPPAGTYGGGRSWHDTHLHSARLTTTGQRVHNLLGLANRPADERDAVIGALRGETG